MNDSRIIKIAMAAALLLLIVPAMAPSGSADLLSEKPHYISTQVTFFFKTEDVAELKVNYTWYGLWANDLERLLNRTGEENYTRGFLDYVKKTLKGPFIGGDMEFYPTSMKVDLERSTYKNESKRIDLILLVQLEAKKGAPTVSEGRKGVVYTTREDYTNVTRLFVKELDLLNMTVILPKDYVVSIARPSPNAIYLTNISGEIRVAVSWMLKSPTVDTRESSGYSGWFFLGVVNHTKEEVEALSKLRQKIAEIRRTSSLAMDDVTAEKAKRLFELYYGLSTLAPRRVDGNISYALELANEIALYPVNPEIIVSSVSLGAVVLEVVGYLLYRRRIGRRKRS